MNILERIFAHKRLEVELRRAARPLETVRREAGEAPPPLDFTGALKGAARRPALVAEIKRASPSRGRMVEDFDPLRLARVYAQNGASAISVLTDERFFEGSLEHLRQVTRPENWQGARLPVLRKDFLCDPYQVFEARAAGADAVLLIAACLEPETLSSLQELAGSLGMAALVEVHNREELAFAVQSNAKLIGINNRDLRDFSVRLETTLEMRPLAPASACLVAESGIHTPEDVACLGEAGVDAILVGEALVTAPDVAARVRELAGMARAE